jgi:hypothetical protein
MSRCTCYQVEGDGPYYICQSGCERCPICNPPEKQLEERRDFLQDEINRKKRRIQLVEEIKRLEDELKTLRE